MSAANTCAVAHIHDCLTALHALRTQPAVDDTPVLLGDQHATILDDPAPDR